MRSSTQSVNTNYICLTAALGGLLFGFDTAVISGALGMVKQQFALSTTLEGWFVSSGLLGCIIGVVFTGFISDTLGRKKSILISGAMFLLSGIGCAFAYNFDALVISRLLGGIGVGMASVLSPTYIAEFAPATKRGSMISYYQLAITLGILLAYFSNAVISNFSDSHFTGSIAQLFMNDESWRMMFLVMVIPSAAFLYLLLSIPESPRWLVMVGKASEAKHILSSARQDQNIEKEFDEIEKAAKKRSVSHNSLIAPSVRLPLIIGIVLAILQQFCGINAIIYYGPEIFKSAGIASDNALLFQVTIGAVNLLFTFVAIVYADRFGRKFLLKTGLTGIVLSLLLCGLLFYTGNTEGILLLVLMLVFIACFAFSIGPVTWIIINEIFPTEIRVKAVSICALALWVAVWLVGQFFPWLLEKVGIAATFWIFAGFSMINFVFSWKVVKETKGKTLEEMEAVFAAPH